MSPGWQSESHGVSEKDRLWAGVRAAERGGVTGEYVRASPLVPSGGLPGTNAADAGTVIQLLRRRLSAPADLPARSKPGAN
jgi:hypothetical protein